MQHMQTALKQTQSTGGRAMQNTRKALCTVTALIAMGAAAAHAQSTVTRPDADNTRINQADRDNAKPTPQNQSGAKADRDVAAAVRKAIMADKSLSTNAHNVKIVTSGGMVTLRGPVNSPDEKARVVEIARQTADAGNVVDELLVKTQK
jgi:hyperosmotically inducible protein